MATTKRICGNYTIETLCSGEVFINSPAVTLSGDLVVQGDTSTVESTVVTIADNTIVLNQGQTGAGISAIYGADGVPSAGIAVDRGTEPDTRIRYNESNDRWEGTDDGTTWYPLNPAFQPSNFEVIDDPTPQLGGDLDVNGFEIGSAANGDVVITADGTGLVKVDKALTVEKQATDPAPVAGYTHVYSKEPDKGQTGLYVAGDTIPTDEVISRRRALVYSIIL